MRNKRGIELSINFIVVLILSIVIFVFGIVFMRNLFVQLNGIRDLTLEDLDSKIGSLICEGSERVCIGYDRKTIQRKEFAVFGLKILNILDTQDFIITVAPPDSYLGFKKDKTEILSPPTNPKLIVYPETRTKIIAKNEEKPLGIGVKVPANAVSGTYILDVRIQYNDAETGEPKDYTNVHKIYVEVP